MLRYGRSFFFIKLIFLSHMYIPCGFFHHSKCEKSWGKKQCFWRSQLRCTHWRIWYILYFIYDIKFRARSKIWFPLCYSFWIEIPRGTAASTVKLRCGYSKESHDLNKSSGKNPELYDSSTEKLKKVVFERRIGTKENNQLDLEAQGLQIKPAAGKPLPNLESAEAHRVKLRQ